MAEKKQKEPEYRKQIRDLLSNYEDGWDIFKNAPDWDYPLVRVEGAEDKNLPESWVELVLEVGEIIARDKYGLDMYPNTISIIGAEEMLAAYSSIGMPVSYNHWSFGKQQAKTEFLYKKGMQGLALEIVINTDPAIAYCMEHNTKTAQMMVILHANCGHNDFFKNNHMFTQFTEADSILRDLRALKEKVAEAEEKYGVEAVEELLDACHALSSHAVDRYTKPRELTAEEKEQRRIDLEKMRQENYDPVMDRVTGRSSMASTFSKKGDSLENTPIREENILSFIERYAPHLKDWQRDIARLVCRRSQYFEPQRATKMMNEGEATLMHYELMNTLLEEGLIDNAMYMEFLTIHSSVIAQQGFDSKNYGGINPYYLGFEMFRDIQRICEYPTDEDREFLPEIAGCGDWRPVFRDARANFKDESFILQYLSPKLIRDMKLFALRDDDQERTYEVSAIHNTRGYDHVREILASMHRPVDMNPDIEVMHYNFRYDRSLILHHKVYDRQELELGEAKEVLKHMYQLWGHPVVLHSIDAQTGKRLRTLNCPENMTLDNTHKYKEPQPA